MRIATHPEAIKHLVKIGMAADISEHIKMVESATEALEAENARLKAEVERLTADIEVYKEGVMKSDNLFQSIGIFVKDEEWVSDGITQLIERANKAEAEVERLTKAGDTLVAAYCMGDKNKERWAEYPVVREWLAAKEGKQP
jgi:predicted RNase H-like nuclease (RuvC/YqgF family)